MIKTIKLGILNTLATRHLPELSQTLSFYTVRTHHAFKPNLQWVLKSMPQRKIQLCRKNFDVWYTMTSYVVYDNGNVQLLILVIQ